MQCGSRLLTCVRKTKTVRKAELHLLVLVAPKTLCNSSGDLIKRADFVLILHLNPLACQNKSLISVLIALTTLTYGETKIPTY